jgi:hypothetical protein
LLAFVALVGIAAAQRGDCENADPVEGNIQICDQWINWAYEPEGLLLPGVDFLGWGYDASYRDTFFALKPLLFRWSFANNAKGSERTFQYPLYEDMQWPIPDQAFARTVAKTVTNTEISDTKQMNRMKLDLRLGIEGSTPQFSGSLEFKLGITDEKNNIRRIVTSMAETQLFQIYLGKRYLNPDVSFDMDTLDTAGPFKDSSKPSYFLFLSTWGTHFVDSVTVGGSVTQSTDYKFSNASNALMIAVAIKGSFDGGSGTKVSGFINFDFNTVKQDVKAKTIASATIIGGAAEFSDFTLNSDDPASAKKLYESWKNTLMENPVAVRYRLVEIWTLWPTLRDNYDQGENVCAAIANYLGFANEDDYCDGVPMILGFSERDPSQNVFKGDTGAN